MLRNPLRRRSAAVAAMAASAALAVGGAAAAQTFTPPPFPRLAGVEYGSPFDYNDSTYQAELAKLSLMILNYWPGMAPGGQSMQSVVQAIKAINPNALVFLYTDSDEQFTNPSGSANASLINQLNSMQWWLYTDGTSGIVPSFFGDGGDTINNTPYTPKDSSGDDSIDYITKWFVSNYYTAVPNIDGFFMDNVFVEPRVAGDWYRDGELLQPSDPRAQAAIQAGYERWFQLAHQLMPGKYQIGNIATWDQSGQPALPSGYEGMVDGGLLEAMIGESYSIETWGGWQEMMSQYDSVMPIVNSAQLVIFNQWGSPTDYQSFRYGFASCLMNNGYYSFTSSSAGYSGVTWFDEYNASLGAATSDPPTSAWQSGVWRRDFANGIALVNPKGNGVQTVQLGGTFVKINGTQDPAVNDGQTVTSVTLQDRDGIILLRTTPQTSSGNDSSGNDPSGSDTVAASDTTNVNDTFGQTSIASTPSAGLTANFKRGSRFTLGAQGTLADLSAYLDGNAGGSGEQSVRMDLYQDSGGVPGALVAESTVAPITAGQPGGWVTFSAPSANLAPGAYWIVLESGDASGVARDYGDGAADWYGNADTFASGPSNPFGAGATGTDTLSVNATYYPSDAQQFGRASVATTPSAGLTANFKRGSKFSVGQQGELLGLSAYLDGSGGASGAQDVRMDLYQDDNGVPGALVAQSSVVAITAGQPAAWINFPTPAAALAPGAYWIVIDSGGGSGVARDYDDGTADWYGNANTFADGASAQFGAGSAGSGTLSVYATYVTTQTFGRTDVASTPSAGLTANFKRGSKFTLGAQGTLSSLSAYLDGNGGGSGEQSVRMDLYQDSDGVPGALVAESSVVSVTAAQPAGWITFSTPSVSLAPGAYWIVLESGDTSGIARDYGDGAADWYGNADTFSAGPSNPFGAGSVGTDTLSVYATVTPAPTQ